MMRGGFLHSASRKMSAAVPLKYSMRSCKTQPLTWENHQVRIERKIEESDETVSKHI
ncbi:unnamed protein product [Sphagnum troendelagicum]|uniref:Ribosomal protein S15 n=1 Tax=Sphagnum troendelagicum TaxID=128251 RepID=A0ABP0UNM3_9BRYO